MHLPIYLDYAATTPVDPRVAKQMCAYLTEEGQFGNPASLSHCYGRVALEAVEQARAQVAALVNADPKEIIWTSGATEANNLAIKGVAHYYRTKGRHIITCSTEHKSVLDSCQHIEKEGFTISYLNPEPSGLIDLDKIKSALRKETVLVSIMHVNNEIGVIQDIAAIGALCRAQGIFFHVDAAQSAGKVDIDLQALAIDLMSFSAHKVYGPKGVGALFLRRKPKVRLQALIHGGGQEQGIRSGTIPTHQVVGMGTAFALAKNEMAVEIPRVKSMRDRLWQGIQGIPGLQINGTMDARVAGNLNITVSDVEGSALVMALRDIAVSLGSACTSASIEPSHVLRALGLSAARAHNSLRISLGRYTTEAEVDFVNKHIHEKIAWLRSLSPVWNDV